LKILVSPGLTKRDGIGVFLHPLVVRVAAPTHVLIIQPIHTSEG
jgi:hypothetical protein